MKTPDSLASISYITDAHIEHTSTILQKDPKPSSYFHDIQFKVNVKGTDTFVYARAKL